MVKIYYFISACLLLFSCNNYNTQVSSFDDTTDTISSIKRNTIVEKDTIAPIQVPKEETDEATKMILEFYLIKSTFFRNTQQTCLNFF